MIFADHTTTLPAPSAVPFYTVHYRTRINGRLFEDRETVFGRDELIRSISVGAISTVQSIYLSDPVANSCRNITEEIARAVASYFETTRDQIDDGTVAFLEDHLGVGICRGLPRAW